jgi:hypothetical protein
MKKKKLKSLRKLALSLGWQLERSPFHRSQILLLRPDGSILPISPKRAAILLEHRKAEYVASMN